MKMNIRNQLAVLFALICCVLSHTNAQFRIINGEDIDITEIPHTVAILECNLYKCVGSLVSYRSVVTVGHCVKDRLPIHITVLAGVTHLEKEKGQRQFVKEIYVHPDYDCERRYMDIAMVIVKESFEDNVAVKTIKLCEEGTLAPGLSMQVSGWGGVLDLNTEDFSPLLKTKRVQIVQCRNVNMPSPNALAETLIFAGITGNDLNYRDSGAAGVRDGRLCAVAQNLWEGKNPVFFIDVTHFRVKSFIEKYM